MSKPNLVLKIAALLCTALAVPALAGPPADAPVVHVHIDSPDPKVELVRLAGVSQGTGYVGGRAATLTTIHLENMCRAPCDLQVPGGYANKFFVAGDGITASDAFDLASYKDSVNLKVKPG